MNDNDLMTAVRDRFAPVRMDTPADVIVARGRALRRRRHSGRLAAGALAVSLGAGLSVPALTGGTTAAAQQATLAAWTVQEHPDGSIGVTIRQPKNLATLERRLAALGTPVVIRFSNALAALAARVCVLPSAQQAAREAVRFKQLPHAVFFVIRPHAVPQHDVLWIIASLPKAAAAARAAAAAGALPKPLPHPVVVYPPRVEPVRAAQFAVGKAYVLSPVIAAKCAG